MQIPPHLDLSDVCWAIDLQEINQSSLHRRMQLTLMKWSMKLLARLNDTSNTVNAQYTRGEARVIFTLQVSRVARSEGDIYDIIIQRKTSKTPRCGHGTQAVLVVSFYRDQDESNTRCASAVDDYGGSKALRKLKRDHGFTSDTQKCNYLSPL